MISLGDRLGHAVGKLILTSPVLSLPLSSLGLSLVFPWSFLGLSMYLIASRYQGF